MLRQRGSLTILFCLCVYTMDLVSCHLTPTADTQCRSGDPGRGHRKPRYSYMQEYIDPGEANTAGRQPSDPSGMSQSFEGVYLALLSAR